MRTFPAICGLLAIASSVSGCIVAAAAGAGYMIHDEATERDGEFDPLEKVFKEDDGEKDDN